MSACQAAFSVLLLLVACGRSSSSATPPGNNEDAPLVRTCEEVQMRCAQRKGCGSALHAYLYQCNEVIQAGASQCPVPCQRALAALTSTDEGRGLSDCECGENDVCRKSKLRVEVCREAVEKLTAPRCANPVQRGLLDVRGRAPVRHGARLLLPLLPRRVPRQAVHAPLQQQPGHPQQAAAIGHATLVLLRRLRGVSLPEDSRQDGPVVLRQAGAVHDAEARFRGNSCASRRVAPADSRAAASRISCYAEIFSAELGEKFFFRALVVFPSGAETISRTWRVLAVFRR
ncbi:hypothetical protein MRX96_022931 [Rhipicephalus microplus]